jgi:hypothetical protein
MSVPYTFATAATPLLLSELDVNFATPITLGSTALILGGTYTTISGLTLNSPVFTGTFSLGTPTSGTLTNCTGYTYANLAGTIPTWNQDTTGNAATATNANSANSATNATNATNINNPGGWSVTPTGTKLYFNYNGTNLASLDSSGNFVALNNVTAYGTP